MTRTTVGIREAVRETVPLSNVTFDELTACNLAADQAVANRGKLACAKPILEKEGCEGERPIVALAHIHSRYRANTFPPIKVLGLNHFNITASELLIERVKRFYTDVIGLTIGPRAPLDHKGYWLYAGPVAIVHLSARQAIRTVIPPQKSYLNHISLSCVGLSLAIGKLKATCTPYQITELPDREQTQIFVTDPAGIGVELTFDEVP